MKKLLILLSISLIISCGGDTENLSREITWDMKIDGYTGKGTYTEKEGTSGTNASDLGNVYVGEFMDGDFHGQGTYTVFKNGDVFEGEWEFGLFTGKGTATYSDGNKYVGEWNSWMWDGMGTWTHRDGDMYVGEFKNHQRNGQGTYTTADGTVFEGIWENGKLIEQ